MDEHAFIARVEAANAEEFRELMAHPTAEEERILRIHLGATRYQHMHSLALTRSRSVRGAPKGNVVCIPGIMGSELTSYSRSGDGDHLWLDLVRIVNGRLDRLRLSDDGRSGYNDGYDVRATGILKRYYGELMLALSENWTVRAFWFDWRKDLNVAAAELSAQMSNWFDHDAPVHIVAHSLGGLVARTFIGNFPDQWERMKDPGDPATDRAELTLGGRLVMMGTPNHGSFSIPQAILGLEETVSKLAMVDLRHNKEEILEILNSFVATYQMLPSPLAVPEAEPLYDESSYGTLDILPQRLTTARRHHERLRDVIQPDRMIYIAGSNRPTFSSIINYDKLQTMDGYQVTLNGDGRVPHALGDLRSKDGGIVPMFYIDEDHGGLSSNRDVLDSLDDLLRTGSTKRLSNSVDDLPKSRRKTRGAAAQDMDARSQREAEIAEDQEQLRTLLGQSRSWRSAVDGGSRRRAPETGGAAGDTDPVTDTFVSIHEREIEELITRGVIGSREPGARRLAVEVPFEATSIEIRLVDDAIENIGVKGVGEADTTPVDVIAVGHYLGVRPEGAELSLDQAVSLASPTAKRKSRSIATDADLLLTQFAERGTIRGDLGQTFFLPDTRVRGSTVDRTIAVVGMGPSGRFGVPELTVVARELCWAVGRMGKQHLATVMIGAGLGNLSVRDATLAWMRGIKQAITGMEVDDPHRLLRVSFAIRNPDSYREAHEAIVDEQHRLREAERLIFDFQPLGKDELETVTQRLRKKRQAAAKSDRGTNRAQEELPPARLTVTMDRNTYLFGAITGGASIPERRIPIDPLLIKDANDELSAAWDPAMQYERGRFLEQLLLPDDLRNQIYSPAPLVLMLDSTTARIHWEMVALSEPELIRRRDEDGDGHDYGFDERRFLGTSRALTRQLRTTFAPPPDPTPPPRRVMRVLVVADPAEDASLPGAEEEGVAVADLFEQFNTVYKDGDNRVEVVRMFGPQEATRTNVLRELTNRSYDVLHYAGHCVYDEKDPPASGWVFSKGQRISASELARIDRVPNFVFSNACESGITPDRREARSVELAPSFAEAFFARGVSNFVCTAWPVDDLASERFARTLYAGLLGLEETTDEQGRQTYTPIRPRRMHEAMLEARLKTAAETNGAQSWGAYQHYGNPYLYFFDTSSMNGEDKDAKEDG